MTSDTVFRAPRTAIVALWTNSLYLSIYLALR